MTKVSFGYVDHSDEDTSVQLNIEDVDAANFDATFGSSGVIADLHDALALATDCVAKHTTATIASVGGTGIAPSTVTAQREIAVRVSYMDQSTGQMYRFDIPGPKVGFYPPTGTDIIPLDNAIAAGIVTAIGVNCVSPAGNAVVVTGMKLVGRNN